MEMPVRANVWGDEEGTLSWDDASGWVLSAVPGCTCATGPNGEHEPICGWATVASRQELSRLGFVRADDLMSGTDLAELFAVGRSTIGGWAHRRRSNGMPEPVAKLATGPVYDGHAVVQWWKRWRPRKGRRVGTLPDGM